MESAAARPRPAPLSALDRLSLYGYGFGGLFSAACSFLTDLYQPGAWRTLAPASLVLCAFSLWICVRRRETTTQGTLCFGYVLLLVGLQAFFAATDEVGTAMTLALGMVLMGAAMRLPHHLVLALMALAALEIALLDPLTSSGAASAVMIDGGVMAVCLLPPVTVLGYRRQLERALEQVRLLAATDPLTGLANRRGLAAQMPVIVALAAREGRSVGVLSADLDRFKWINDQFGHAVGDQVLQDVAAAVSATVRQRDLVARLGGEELCVIALLDHPGAVHALAERVRHAVEQASTRPPVTVSVGAVELSSATLDAGGTGAEDMLWRVLDQADTLMYAAKGAGRNAVRVLTL